MRDAILLAVTRHPASCLTENLQTPRAPLPITDSFVSCPGTCPRALSLPGRHVSGHQQAGHRKPVWPRVTVHSKNIKILVYSQGVFPSTAQCNPRQLLPSWRLMLAALLFVSVPALSVSILSLPAAISTPAVVTLKVVAALSAVVAVSFIIT